MEAGWFEIQVLLSKAGILTGGFFKYTDSVQ